MSTLITVVDITDMFEVPMDIQNGFVMALAIIAISNYTEDYPGITIYNGSGGWTGILRI